MKRIIIQKNHKILSVLMGEKRILEAFSHDEENSSDLNTVYIGKVTNVVKNINACFVNIGKEQDSYLALNEVGEGTVFTKSNSKTCVCPGDELLVMVMREPVKTKPSALTTKITMTGRYLALCLDGKKTIGVSRKIADKEIREKLSSLTIENWNEPVSVIVRTNAANAPFEEVKKEADMLMQSMNELIKSAPYRTAKTCVYRPAPLWMTEIRDTKDDTLSEIFFEDETLLKEFTEFAKIQAPALIDRIHLYQSDYQSLIKAFSIEKQLKEALMERVWMKSGAYLVIQPTEALTVIDVNSGKAVGKKKPEEAFPKINEEAAREIAMQIRLRNLSGIIIVDFINMESKECEEKLLSSLRGFLAEDPVKTRVVDITGLGLVEITRQKKKRPIYETEIGIFLE